MKPPQIELLRSLRDMGVLESEFHPDGQLKSVSFGPKIEAKPPLSPDEKEAEDKKKRKPKVDGVALAERMLARSS